MTINRYKILPSESSIEESTPSVGSTGTVGIQLYYKDYNYCRNSIILYRF